MPGPFDIPRYKKGDPLHAATVNSVVDEVRKLNRVRGGSGISARMGAGGLALGLTLPAIVKVAKVGTTAIPAMSTLTPGSGSVTLYDMGQTALLAGVTDADTVYNTEFSPIAAGSWIKVVEVDGRWFVAQAPVGHVALNGASTIPARSGTTPGSGTVTLQAFAGSTLTGNGSVTAYNMTSAAVAAGRYLQVKRIDGYFFVDVESCT